MNKTLLSLGAAMLLAICACTPKTEARAEAEPAPAAATTGSDTQAEAEPAADSQTRNGTVIALRNDKVFRPGHKVKRLTVLDFNATWCGPCRQLAPVFKQAANKYKNVDFISVDVDKMPATAQAFNVQAVPTVVILSPNGTERSFVGTADLLPAESFYKILDNALK
ncbi:MAG: thioredoxin family protein [Odoribacter sp.]|nr:thioredoxin family protein [Odoribacter sp.]